MKIKVFSLICALLIAVMGFVACEDEDGASANSCKHTFDASWTSNETHHWHKATCEHGENRGDYAEHIDADEDGVCDACEFEVGHIHTYASKWSYDEEKHWKAASCTHTAEKGEASLHADDDINGLCDVCGAHTHILDNAGFCSGCGAELAPIDENNLGAVVLGVSSRYYKILSGKVEYKVDITSSVSGTVLESRWHNVEYLFGTNGTYSKRTEDEYDDSGVKTGNILTSEKWMAYLGDDAVEGVFATSVDGVYTHAEPSAFGLDDLRGYYFAASTLADGHGPESLLLALYSIAVEENSENKVDSFVFEINTADNTGAFSYNVLTINTDTAAGEGDNVNYYVVSVSFSYTDDYTLVDLDINVDCYTNTLDDANEHDFSYNQATKTITLYANASADTYNFKVTQTSGDREAIALEDGTKFTPADFELYTDKALTQQVASMDLLIGDNSKVLYFGCAPEGTYVRFLSGKLQFVVKDERDNLSQGVQVFLQGEEICIIPVMGGNYVVTVEYNGHVKSFEIKVNAAEIGGAYSFDVVIEDSHTWDTLYTFTAETKGTYTFYLPANFGICEKGAYESNGNPIVDPGGLSYDSTAPHSYTIVLWPGESFNFYCKGLAKGTYTVGYDIK